MAPAPSTPRFEIFVDGGCRMCSHEARLLTRLDKGRGHLKVIDLGSPEFESAATGLAYDAAMRSIHGRTPDGRLVHGVEVFRLAYRAVGYGWVWAPTGWPVLKQAFDALYRVFAKWRYRRRIRQGCGAEPAPGEASVPTSA